MPQIPSRVKRPLFAGAKFEILEARCLLSVWAAHINFEPAGAPVPAGYVADTGATFGDRGNGLSYGWDSIASSAARIRHMAADVRYDTFIHMQLYGTHTWEIAVPNGTYTVHIVAGDPGYIDSVDRITANGMVIVNGTPTNSQHWIEGTAQETVSNGMIVVGNAAGSYNNKIDYIDVTSVAPPPPTVVPPPPPTVVPPAPPTIVPPPPASSPFYGSPLVAGRPIEAEDFDNGGPGIAYHVTVPPRLVSPYRATDVAIQPGGSNGYDIGSTTAGEWLQYTILAPVTGKYLFTAGVACQGVGGRFHASFDGVNLTGALAVPDTGGWQVYNTVAAAPFTLTAGTHVMRVCLDANSPIWQAVGNFDVFNLTPISASVSLPWTKAAATPVARFEGYAGVVNGKLYTFGGFTNLKTFAVSDEADAYDPATGSWTDLGPAPIPETHSGVAVDEQDGLIFFVGGLRGGFPGVAASDVWQYDTNANRWTQLPSLPEPLSAGSAAFVAGQIHYFGGNVGADHVTDYGVHFALALGDSAWNAAAPEPDPRDHVGAVALNGKIYTFGGEYGHNTSHQSSDAWSYDPTADAWTKLPDVPIGVSHMEGATFTSNGEIYVAGGQADKYQATSDFFKYDIDDNSWVALPSLPAALEGEFVQPIGNQLIVTSGYTGYNYISSAATWLAPWNP